ncbi:MarR family transcriptional regulator [Hyphobacterium sp. CCMP332]|nr:MarR family transcriptional regulator [Hyphobacterium sp. CCMP332]
MKAKETVDFNIKTAWHAIFRMYNNEASKHEITTSMGYVLINIDDENGTPATKIGPMIGMEIHSLSRMIKNMEERGLILRMADKEDGRVTRIFLTELGKEKREISKKTIRKFNHAVQEVVPKEKLDTFFEVIDNINHLIDNNHIFRDQ